MTQGRYRVYAPCRDQIDKGLFVCLPLNIRGPLLHDHLRSTKDGHPICNHRRGRSTVSSAEERETLDRALTEDQNAYNKLYRTHRDRIQAPVSQRAKDPDDIDNLVQVSFIRTFRSLGKLREDSAFSTWLTRIALNVCITHHQGRRPMLPESVIDTEVQSRVQSPTVEDRLDRQLRWDVLLEDISKLPPRYRSVITIHFVEDHGVSGAGRTTKHPAWYAEYLAVQRKTDGQGLRRPGWRPESLTAASADRMMPDP